MRFRRSAREVYNCTEMCTLRQELALEALRAHVRNLDERRLSIAQHFA